MEAVAETWISLGGQNNAARLLLKQVGAMRGVGVGQLRFVFEATSRHEVADERPLWIRGSLGVTNLGVGSGYLAMLIADQQPLTLAPRGGSRDFTLTADVDGRQLQVIEDVRTRGLKFTLDLAGFSFREGAPEPF